jgi:hypothetical protein
LKRKLLLLDLALAALMGASGWRLCQNWGTARARERMVLGKVVKPLAPPPLSDLPAVRPLTAAGYGEVAQKMLFSKDRNPTVIVVVEVKEKPMPPLPVLHGVVDVGDGPVAILKVNANSQDHGFRPGDDVGEFKLVAVNSKEIVFHWDDKVVKKTLEELMDKTAAQQAPAVETTPRPPAAAPAPPPSSGRPEPGASMGGDLKACQPSDNSPAGTVVDGLRKVIAPTPFGNTCRWEPAK